ncbi:MAG: hypothetical protein NVSMB47_05510 [Polyangiales bacterium]
MSTGGLTYDCAGVTGDFDVVGVLVAVDAQSFQIDTCAPGTGCASTLTTVSATAPGLDLRSLPVGSFVEARLRSYRHPFYGCTSLALVTSLDTWGGTPNPADVGGRTYFVGSDGSPGVPDAPFTVDLVANHCVPEKSGCGSPVPPDTYRMKFRAGTSSLELPMSSSGSLELPGGGALVVRNLRSYQTSNCEDYYNYAFWAVRAEPKPL